MSYSRAHYRVKQLWGAAKQYPCIRCNNPACDWAYDWTDPSSRTDYSDWPEFYMPMCRSCHRRYDRTECYAVLKKIVRVEPEPVFVEPRTVEEWDEWLKRQKARKAVRTNG